MSKLDWDLCSNDFVLELHQPFKYTFFYVCQICSFYPQWLSQSINLETTKSAMFQTSKTLPSMASHSKLMFNRNLEKFERSITLSMRSILGILDSSRPTKWNYTISQVLKGQITQGFIIIKWKDYWQVSHCNQLIFF